MKRILLLIVIVQLSLNSFGQSTTVNYYDQYGRKTGTAKIQPDNDNLNLPTYQPTIPLELLKQAGQQRKAVIQHNVNAIGKAINDLLMPKYPKEGKALWNKYAQILDDINSRSNDLSLDAVYDPIYNCLDKLFDEVLDTKNRLEDEDRNRARQ